MVPALLLPVFPTVLVPVGTTVVVFLVFPAVRRALLNTGPRSLPHACLAGLCGRAVGQTDAVLRAAVRQVGVADGTDRLRRLLAAVELLAAVLLAGFVLVATAVLAWPALDWSALRCAVLG